MGKRKKLRFQEGGVVPGLHKSPQLIVVHREPVIPLSWLKEMIGDSKPGENDIIININTNIPSEEELLALSDKIKKSIIEIYRLRHGREGVPSNYRPS